MEIWTIVLSIWLATWGMTVGRTYGPIIHMVADYEGGKIITQYKYTHALIYIICMGFIAPFVWQICFFEEPRRNFVISYVRNVVRRKK